MTDNSHSRGGMFRSMQRSNEDGKGEELVVRFGQPAIIPRTFFTLKTKTCEPDHRHISTQITAGIQDMSKMVLNPRPGFYFIFNK